MIRCGATMRMVVDHYKSVEREEHIAESYQSLRAEYRKLCETKEFSEDWFSGNIPHWVDAFHHAGIQPSDKLKILEIGSFQGRSALFLAQYFSSAHIDCVDTWEGSDEHILNSATITLGDVFRKNLEGYAGVKMHVMTSSEYFLKSTNDAYDIIYIDGSHRASDVLLDVVSAFYRLRRGGLLMLDDYLWKHYSHAEKNPCVAINSFFKIFENEVNIVRFGYQMYLMKI